MENLSLQLLKVAGIVWVNVILSGDNAIMIAMACRGLPKNKRRMGMVLGAGVAVALRIVFTILVVALLSTPFLKIIGGFLLLWVSVKLLAENETENTVKQTDLLWHAVWTIAVADAIMSLDNVLAIAALAKDSTFLLILSLAVSIPVIVTGASFIMILLDRVPFLVWAAAALLGWVAGGMISSDLWVMSQFGEAASQHIELLLQIIGALAVLLLGYTLRKRSVRQTF